MTSLSQTNDVDDARPRLHPALAARFSPLSFDPAHHLTEADDEVLLEAARWVPSAGNSQPWMLQVDTSTLCRWRQAGVGPRPTWLARSMPRYQRREVMAWIERMVS